jgi:hypothetical protein
MSKSTALMGAIVVRVTRAGDEECSDRRRCFGRDESGSGYATENAFAFDNRSIMELHCALAIA